MTIIFFQWTLYLNMKRLKINFYRGYNFQVLTGNAIINGLSIRRLNRQNDHLIRAVPHSHWRGP